VYSFLCGRLRSEADAHDLFGQLAEDAMRGIERFEWRASFRTWLYTLAHTWAASSPTRSCSETQAPIRSRSRRGVSTSVWDV